MLDLCVWCAHVCEGSFAGLARLGGRKVAGDSNHELVANILRNSVGALAGYAAGDLLELRPAAGRAFRAEPFSTWRSWLKGRIEELAAAIEVGRPEIFTAQIQWGRIVLQARGIEPEHFRAGIECLREVFAKELPAEARPLAEEYLRRALERFGGAAQEAVSRLSSETAAGRVASRYLLAALEGDRRRARETVLKEGTAELSVPQIYLEVVLPVQEEIGRMWLANEITVAEEHLATSTTRSVLAQLLAMAPMRARNGKTAMTAAVAGNRHDIGLQVVCDFFEMEGWKAIQLGADVPIGDLAEAVDCFDVDLLALSVTQTVHLPTLRETVQAVRTRRDGAAMKILVGGLALRSCPDTAEQLGADAYAAGPLEAVKTAASLFKLPHDPGFFFHR